MHAQHELTFVAGVRLELLLGVVRQGAAGWRDSEAGLLI